VVVVSRADTKLQACCSRHRQSQPHNRVAAAGWGRVGVNAAATGGWYSSALHVDQTGQPPRLGCLGMCTGQCAVVDVDSKCWRNMFCLICACIQVR